MEGSVTKQDIVARYFKGRILWKNIKVAEWDESSGKMNLFGKVLEWEGDFNKLMSIE